MSIAMTCANRKLFACQFNRDPQSSEMPGNTFTGD